MNAPGPGSTIFALATPAGRAAVAVMRISGARSAEVLTLLCGGRLPTPRRAVLRRLRGADGELVDEALVLWMPAPASFTGEDSAELHLHGGRAVVSDVSALLGSAGLRMAEPGEFTRRAFENGRLDLSQAEAISDLVEAESGAQRRQALAQLGGTQSRRFEAWREALLDALALIEAEIDFSDEEIPDAIGATALSHLHQVSCELQAALADLRGERVREGYRVAIIGAPNVGKSSLLNALTGREAAIVTAVAGTTRDVVEVPVSLAGQMLVLADTAGLRSTDDMIEAEGVRRAQAWAASADLRIGVVDLTRPETLQNVIPFTRTDDLIVFNKADLAGPVGIRAGLAPPDAITASAAIGDVGALQASLERWLHDCAGSLEFPAVTRARHRALLEEAVHHLERATESLKRGAELGAEDVRLAIRALERITGRSDPEAVLDRVFASFCIGK